MPDNYEHDTGYDFDRDTHGGDCDSNDMYLNVGMDVDKDLVYPWDSHPPTQTDCASE